MRGFYGQRCGTAVDMGPEFPGYAHPPATCTASSTPSGVTGRATTLAAGTMRATMAATWSTPASPPVPCCGHGRFTGESSRNISLKIPESGNGTPDILNEARWNLEWMLKMQDDDGGVWHKQTSEHFSGFIAPEDDTLPSEVIGTGAAPYKSTCATADLAAVGAIAARVYQPYDAKFAARDHGGGAQGLGMDREVSQRHLQKSARRSRPASTAMPTARTSGCGRRRSFGAPPARPRINDFFLKNYAEFLPSLDSPPAENWASVAPMGCGPMPCPRARARMPKRLPRFAQRTVAAARAIVERTRANPYHDQHASQGLCLGFEWRCGWIRRVSADRQSSLSRTTASWMRRGTTCTICWGGIRFRFPG